MDPGPEQMKVGPWRKDAMEKDTLAVNLFLLNPTA
jgi:hypothetical protein